MMTMTVNSDHLLSSYSYELPIERIAQNPVTPRDSSKLMVVGRDGQTKHQTFRDLSQLLKPGDLLVLNNTKVMPARLYGHKTTGAPVEVLLLEEKQPNYWLALVKPGKRLKLGSKILFSHHPTENLENSPFMATVVERDEATGGRWLQLTIPPDQTFDDLLREFGHVPLPPYITDSQAFPEQYQTIYAQKLGSSAAPTAGLHFTEELMTDLKAKNIDTAFITLHVGVGTFRPLEVEDVTTHRMHGEWLEVSSEVVAKIQQTQAAGGRVIAVGTTAVRALETAAATGKLQPFMGKSELYIYPGYKWQVVQGMVTNFHLPRSSLLLLVAALIGRSHLLKLYQEAIAKDYRFYSFGDAMLITPEAVIES